jgi:FkbM family methyltransferase
VLFDLGTALRSADVDMGGVLHIGAHTGQEADLYASLGASPVVWVEANPAVLPRLKARVEPRGQIVLEALLAEEAGHEVDFYVTNNELSSSMLTLGTHAEEHPDVVVTQHLRLTTDTLDALFARHGLAGAGLNVLVLDVQGAELKVLGGATTTLAGFDAVCLEINEQSLYEGCALLPEVESFFAEHGLQRAVVAIGAHGYGDGLFVRPADQRITRSPAADESAAGGGPNARRWLGSRARGVVADATAARFDRIDRHLEHLVDRVIDIETSLSRIEHELPRRDEGSGAGDA